MKANVVLVALFLLNANIYAKDDHGIDIDKLLSRNKTITDLNHKIKVIEAKSALAKANQECFKNGGCTEALPASVMIPNNNNQTNDEAEVDEAEVEALRRQQKNTETISKFVNQLNISAIINGRVVFKGLESYYAPGDEIIKNVTLFKINDASVFIKTPFGIKKITMDWILDSVSN